MTRSVSCLLWIIETVYRKALLVYPRAFRRSYGDDLLDTFRAHVRDAHRQGGIIHLLQVCGAEFCDLATTAVKEYRDDVRTTFERRRNTAAAYPPTRVVSPRLWGVRVATMIAFAVSMLVSLNLYLVEDASPLTQAAYSTSPVLRLSYDAVYLSALAAGVAVCSIVAYAVAGNDAVALIGLAVVTILVALGGFGGLLVRHPATFLVLFLAFAGIVTVSILLGHIATACAQPHLGRQPALILGSCATTSLALLANVLVLVPHTLILNPVSHALYMQGQIAGTHFNSLLLGMALEFVAVVACASSVGKMLRTIQHTQDGNDHLTPSV